MNPLQIPIRSQINPVQTPTYYFSKILRRVFELDVGKQRGKNPVSVESFLIILKLPLLRAGAVSRIQIWGKGGTPTSLTIVMNEK
jgi:hypothetical protein